MKQVIVISISAMLINAGRSGAQARQDFIPGTGSDYVEYEQEGLDASNSIHYVSLNGSHTYPFTNWISAATNIQAAVDAATNGHAILVTNGTYYLSAEIVVANDIHIQSINGPAGTIIDGNNSVRCLTLGSNSCVLSGFMIQNANIQPGNQGAYGAGIYCDTTDPLITNCVIQNCNASGDHIYRRRQCRSGSR